MALTWFILFNLLMYPVFLNAFQTTIFRKSSLLKKSKFFMSSPVITTNNPLSSHSTSSIGKRSQTSADDKNIGRNNKHRSSLAINVLVDSRIRTYLNMKNHERKTRFLLPAEMTDDKINNKYLRESIEKKLVSLFDQPYIVRLFVPGLTSSPKQFVNDNELYNALVFAQNNSLPSIQLYVDIVSGVFPPPQLDYLKNMFDPAETNAYILLSFYLFKPIEYPEEIENELRELWKPFKAVGRIYIATEGINAQMAVPSNVLSNFEKACQSYKLLSDVMLNTDHEITRQQYDENPPFKALHIRIRDQIVADGWKNTSNIYNFDWNKAGREMPPLEWHEKLDDPNSIILDCRNSYESDVGRFDGAVPLNTTFFRESWTVLDEILENTPKDGKFV